MYIKKIRVIKLVIKDIISSCYYRIIKGQGSVDYGNIKSVTFLCYGNICRSPFCEYYLKSRLYNKAAIDVFSEGFFKKQGRSSPENAQIAAKLFDIDLSDHRSKKISTAVVENSSIVIGMHYYHYREFKKEFPSAVHKFHLLKHIANPKHFLLNISDPYGKPIEVFSKCYSEIKVCIDFMVEKIILHNVKETTDNISEYNE